MKIFSFSHASRAKPPWLRGTESFFLSAKSGLLTWARQVRPPRRADMSESITIEEPSICSRRTRMHSRVLVGREKEKLPPTPRKNHLLSPDQRKRKLPPGSWNRNLRTEETKSCRPRRVEIERCRHYVGKKKEKMEGRPPTLWPRQPAGLGDRNCARPQ